MVELLVTLVIIGIVAGMVLGALQMAREAAREAATKATIAKLNSIIMQRYESYMTRRVPIQVPTTASSWQAAVLRLYVLRDLMRMEMPDSVYDITAPRNPYNIPADLRAGTPSFQYPAIPYPALAQVYNSASPTTTWESAQCLYLIISRGSPEMMEQFSQSEIGVTADGKPVFVDGWGTPICWLRWAPGYSNWQGLQPPPPPPPPPPTAPSDIQTGNPAADSDPFDPRRVDQNAFHLIPLICSGGSGRAASLLGITGLADGANYSRQGVLNIASPCAAPITLGSPTGAGFGCITNHHIEAR